MCRMVDVRAGSLAAIFCLVYSLSHYKKQNSQASERPSSSNQRTRVTAGSNAMPSRYSLPFMGTLQQQSDGPLYSSTVIGTLAVDGWAVTFGTARRGLGGLRPRPVPSSLYQM